MWKIGLQGYKTLKLINHNYFMKLQSRVLDKTAVFIHSANSMNPNHKYHESKKTLWQPVHSMVVPKGSPLEVKLS